MVCGPCAATGAAAWEGGLVMMRVATTLLLVTLAISLAGCSALALF